MGIIYDNNILNFQHRWYWLRFSFWRFHVIFSFRKSMTFYWLSKLFIIFLHYLIIILILHLFHDICTLFFKYVFRYFSFDIRGKNVLRIIWNFNIEILLQIIRVWIFHLKFLKIKNLLSWLFLSWWMNLIFSYFLFYNCRR